MDHFDKEHLIRFLLLELSEAERDTVARQMLEQPELFDRLREAEDELIDALSLGKLPAGRRAAVERFVQETGQQNRLAMARVLASAPRLGPRGAGAGRRWIAYSLLAAAACIAVVVMLVQTRGPLDEVARKQTPAAGAAPNAAAQPPGSPLLSLLLTSSTVRGQSSSPRLKLVPGTLAVALDLAVSLAPGQHPWKAAILDSTGTLVLEQSGRANVSDASAEQKLSLLAPASALSPGSYKVELRLAASAVPDAIFFFTIE